VPASDVTITDLIAGGKPSEGGILLVACSRRKLKTRLAVPARLLYRGPAFGIALKIAARYGLELYILSAKYGIIRGDDLITTYDQKLTEPYPGPWPEGPGYCIGSKLYFGKAPKRFKRLCVPGLLPGQQLAHLKSLLTKGLDP
jgi:hypothetical protein